MQISHRSCARRCRVTWRHMALGHNLARHNPSLWRRRFRLELIISQSEARTFTTNSPPQTRSVSRNGCEGTFVQKPLPEQAWQSMARRQRMIGCEKRSQQFTAVHSSSQHRIYRCCDRPCLPQSHPGALRKQFYFEAQSQHGHSML